MTPNPLSRDVLHLKALEAAVTDRRRPRRPGRRSRRHRVLAAAFAIGASLRRRTLAPRPRDGAVGARDVAAPAANEGRA